MTGPERPGGEDYLPLGHVTGAFGVKGWIKVHSFTSPREAILDYQPWLMGPERIEVYIDGGRLQGRQVVAQLPGIGDRDAALALVRQEIVIRREQLPELSANEYYWTDLQGLNVVTTQGVRLGTVSGLLETGANDVLVVSGERERMIPFVPGQYVTGVDLASGQIEVDWDPEFS